MNARLARAQAADRARELKRRREVQEHAIKVMGWTAATVVAFWLAFAIVFWVRG